MAVTASRKKKSRTCPSVCPSASWPVSVPVCRCSSAHRCSWAKDRIGASTGGSLESLLRSLATGQMCREIDYRFRVTVPDVDMDDLEGNGDFPQDPAVRQGAYRAHRFRDGLRLLAKSRKGSLPYPGGRVEIADIGRKIAFPVHLIHFFFLLAVTAIEDSERRAAEELIMQWLGELPPGPVSSLPGHHRPEAEPLLFLIINRPGSRRQLVIVRGQQPGQQRTDLGIQGKLPEPVSAVCALPDGRVLRVEFHYHYCLYFLEETPVSSVHLGSGKSPCCRYRISPSARERGITRAAVPPGESTG